MALAARMGTTFQLVTARRRGVEQGPHSGRRFDDYRLRQQSRRAADQQRDLGVGQWPGMRSEEFLGRLMHLAGHF